MHANARDDYRILYMDPNKPDTFMELPSYTMATTSGRNTDTTASNFFVIAPLTALIACPGRTLTTIGVPVFVFLWVIPMLFFFSSWLSWTQSTSTFNPSSDFVFLPKYSRKQKNYTIFIFSCPEQLNRWPCHSLSHSLTDWVTESLLLLPYKEQS